MIPTESAAAGSPRIASTTILQDFDISPVSDIPGLSALAALPATNGSLAYAYISGGAVYFTWEGAGPARWISGTTAYPPVALRFKPDGSAVVAWIDVRNAGSSSDGTATNWDIYLAEESAGWAETLVTGSTDLRVQTFRMEINADAEIWLAYERFTIHSHPYQPAIFAARSPDWVEVAVSDGTYAQSVDLALDSAGRPHVAWDYWGDLETVWYANESASWTDVRVDTGQSNNWWDDRRAPSVAVDREDHAHVIWVDARNMDPNAGRYRLEIWHGSSADGFANSELVLPEDLDPVLSKDAPLLSIDGDDLMHVAWTGTVAGASNLYYSNGTDWNRAVKITNRTANESFGGSFNDPPIITSAGPVALLFSDSRKGFPTIWKSADWDFGPDTAAPVVGPLRDRVVGVSRGVALQAQGAWDNDRIVTYNWTFTGPEDFSLTGYAIYADPQIPGLYNVTLEVQDPIGLSAAGNFSVDVRPEPVPTGWVTDRLLYDVDRAYGYLELHPETDSFPLTFFPGPAYYSRHLGDGRTVLGPVRLAPDASRESAVFDDDGNLHTVGYEWSSEQLQYTKADRNGTNLVAPMLLPLGGFLPQQPYLAFAAGRLWLGWMDQRDGNFEVYLAALDKSGGITWGPTRLSHDPRGSDEPIVFESGGDLWVVWRDERGTLASVLDVANLTFRFSERRIADGLLWDAAPDPSGGVALAIGVGYLEIQVQRVAPDGTPSAPVLVSYDDGQPDWLADLDVDASGTIHVAWWQAGNGSALRFASVSPDGQVEPVGGILLHTGTGDDLPRVAVRVGLDGEPRVAYTDGSAFTGASLYFADRDLTAPVAVISAPDFANPFVPVTFDGSGSTDNGAVVDHAWDFGDGTATNGAIVNHTYESTGDFVVVLTVTDDHGNTNATNVTIAIGSSSLVAAFTVEPSAAKPGTTFRFNASDSRDLADPNATVEVQWDWEADGLFDTPWSAEKLVEHSYGAAGEYTVVLRVRTSAGDLNETRRTVIVDGDAPRTTAVLGGTPGQNGWFVSQVDVSLVAVDDASGVASTSYRLDGGIWEPYAPFGLAIEGANLLDFYSEDVAGNVEEIRNISIRIDTVAPETSLIEDGSYGGADWYLGPVLVTLSGSDASSGTANVSYRLDGGPWQTAPLSFTIAGDGVHLVEYQASDFAGRVEPLRNFEVRIDSTAPVTSATVEGTAGTAGWYTSDVLVTLEFVDQGSGVVSTQYRTDAGPWLAYSDAFSMSEGIHTVEFASRDAATNQEAPQSITVRVDHSSPALTFSHPKETYTSSDVTIEWSASDAYSGIARYEVRVDDGPFQSLGLATKHTLSLADGDHTVTVRAIDAAGNLAEQTIRFRVDTNVFSFSGPYRGAPTVAIVVAVAIAAALLLVRRRRRPPAKFEELTRVEPDTSKPS